MHNFNIMESYKVIYVLWENWGRSSRFCMSWLVTCTGYACFLPSAKFCILKLHLLHCDSKNVMICWLHFAIVSTWKHFLFQMRFPKNKASVPDGKQAKKQSAGTATVRSNFFSSHCERSPRSARPRQSCSKYANVLQSWPSVGAEGSPGGHFIRRASCRGDFFVWTKILEHFMATKWNLWCDYKVSTIKLISERLCVLQRQRRSTVGYTKKNKKNKMKQWHWTEMFQLLSAANLNSLICYLTLLSIFLLLFCCHSFSILFVSVNSFLR